MARIHRSLLVIILIGALGLRLSGNFYDMPYRFHPDEKKYVNRAVLMMYKGTLNPDFFENPPLYTYAIILALYALFAVQYATGAVKTPAEFVDALSWTVPHALARGLSALAGTMTVLVLFLIGRKFGGGPGGILAALFHAVAFLSVRDAHFAVNDVFMVALVTLAFLFAVRFLETGRAGALILGGFIAGLAAATKYNGAIAILPHLLACVLRQRERDGAIVSDRVREVGAQWLTLLLAGAAGFLLGNPYTVLDHETFLSGFAAQYEVRKTVWRGQSAASVFLLALESLVVELGWPLVLLFPLAAAVCIVRGGARSKATLLALSVVAALFLYHSLQALFFARFMLPSTPFIVLICAWGVVALREASPAPWARRSIALWSGIAILIASPLVRSLYLDLILQRADTRILAKRYFERVAPPGSVVVRGGELYAPPIGYQDYRILNLWSDMSLVQLAGAPADFYLFNSFDSGRVTKVLAAEERSLKAKLESLGFTNITFSPLRDGGDLPSEPNQVYLPYRHLFRYERPGPTVVIYARPGIPLPPPPDSLRESGARVVLFSARTRRVDPPTARPPNCDSLGKSKNPTEIVPNPARQNRLPVTPGSCESGHG